MWCSRFRIACIADLAGQGAKLNAFADARLLADGHILFVLVVFGYVSQARKPGIYQIGNSSERSFDPR
jgi:hypothetical protein